MNKFNKIPATKLSLAFRRPIYGVGINDADYMVQPVINGKKYMCPVYQKWHSMLARCYSPQSLARRPTYEGCLVCSEWMTFSCFSKWYEENYIKDHDLDKDIKIKGNKIYSPDTCLFVPIPINALFTGIASSRDLRKVGVKQNSRGEGYQSNIMIDGKRVYLGYFSSEKVAHKVYIEAKNKEIKRKMKQFPDFAVYLKQYIKEI